MSFFSLFSLLSLFSHFFSFFSPSFFIVFNISHLCILTNQPKADKPNSRAHFTPAMHVMLHMDAVLHTIVVLRSHYGRTLVVQGGGNPME
ncbi:hypothetical protein BGZ63DRAFT_390765 [Mariannaea sp. PMI_226]|nr:hypothetical protein BGZ63DRAFT_390765 [Mariannaea sp. PMI_226]